jgi:hypothetical protein
MFAECGAERVIVWSNTGRGRIVLGPRLRWLKDASIRSWEIKVKSWRRKADREKCACLVKEATFLPAVESRSEWVKSCECTLLSTCCLCPFMSLLRNNVFVRNKSARCSYKSASHFTLFSPRGWTLSSLSISRRSGPQSQYGCDWKGIRPISVGNRTLAVLSVASHFTD